MATVTQESFESHYYIARALVGTRSLFAMTEPQFSSAKDDVTPFKVNGDASTLPDQRIPTATCERAVTGGRIRLTLFHLWFSEGCGCRKQFTARTVGGAKFFCGR